MKTWLTCSCLFLFALTSVADGTDAKAEMESLDQRIRKMLDAAPTGPHGGKVVSPEIRNLMDQRSGGLLIRKTNGKAVQLIDARTSVDDFPKKFVANMHGRLNISVVTRQEKLPVSERAYKYALKMKSADVPAVIMLVSVDDEPTLSVYPEDAVGIINVAKLKANTEEQFHERLSKETWRCIALAFGGYSGAAPNGQVVKSLLSPVFSADDLDKIESKYLTPAQCASVYEAASRIGIETRRSVSYSLACRQGWAPLPTNAIQKVIWDQVHALPANPMKIEFDPKKGR